MDNYESLVPVIIIILVINYRVSISGIIYLHLLIIVYIFSFVMMTSSHPPDPRDPRDPPAVSVVK